MIKKHNLIMFIIKCERDNSHAKVDDKNVIFDKTNPPNEGDEVYFFYNKIKERGEVVMISDDESVIDKTFYELTKKPKSRKLEVLSSSSSGNDDYDDDKTRTLPKKRPRKVNHKYSSESYENLAFSNLTKLKNDLSQDALKKRKKTDLDELESSNKNNSHKKSRKSDKEDLTKSYKKKADDVIQSSIEHSIFDKKDRASRKKSSSPSKDELKKMLEQTQNKLAFADKVNATSMKEFNSSIVKKSSKTEKQNCNNDSRTDSEVDTDEETSKQVNSDNKSKNLFDEYEQDDLNGDKDKKLKSVVPSNKPAAHKVSYNTNPDKTQSDDIKDLIKDDDLYGKEWADEKMEKLMDQIYCKKSKYDLAKTLSSQATHVARRLIAGIFKPSGYLTATFTGQVPRAHKLEKPALQIKPLNENARNEIVDFALQLATNKGWKTSKGVPHTRSEI